MLYLLEQGKSEVFVIQNCLRDKRPLPQAIQNAPELSLGLELYFSAFNQLVTTKHEMGPIPWTAVNDYCDKHEIAGDQEEAMHYLVAALDEVYTKYFMPKGVSDDKT